MKRLEECVGLPAGSVFGPSHPVLSLIATKLYSDIRDTSLLALLVPIIFMDIQPTTKLKANLKYITTVTLPSERSSIYGTRGTTLTSRK